MKKQWMSLFASIIFTNIISTANATEFSIDNFSVIKNGSPFFEDTFSDGLLPPITGTTFPSGIEAMYGTIGSPGPEEKGKLALDTAYGLARPSEVSGVSLLVQRSRLLTATNNDNPAQGLKKNHEITVLATFDLIAPELLLERYGIRLTDFKTGYASNDNVGIAVRRASTGDVRVDLREADFGSGMFNVLGSQTLTESDFLTYDQIALGLFSEAGSDKVSGGFSLLGAEGSTPFRWFTETGTIFEGEEWTRASFIASRVVTGVPESMSIMLFLSGLLAMGFMRRSA